MKLVFFLAAVGIAGIAVAVPIDAHAETVADAVKAAQDKAENGDDHGAWDILSAILKQYPKEFPTVYAMRAQIEGRNRMKEHEIADLEKALAIDKDPKNQVLDHEKVYTMLGEAKEDVGDRKGAIAAYTAVLKSDPKAEGRLYSFLVSNRGEDRFYLGDCAGAVADYSRALAFESEPSFLDYVGLGMAYLCRGDMTNAYRNYRSATAATESDSDPNMKSLTEWDLTAWAVTARFAGRDEADKVLSRRLNEANGTAGTHQGDQAYDAARVFLGQADPSVVAADAKAIETEKKNKDDPEKDIWDSNTYYFSGLKAMVDGHDGAALADFGKVIRMRHAFHDIRPLSRAWIKVVHRHPHKG